MIKYIRTLKEDSGKFPARVKFGFLSTLLAVPGWVLNLGAIYFLQYIYNDPSRSIAALSLYFVIPLILGFLAMVMLLIDLPNKIGVSSRHISAVFLIIHGLAFTWVCVHAVDQKYDGIAIMAGYFVGIIFHQFFAGFFQTIAFTTIVGVGYFLLMNLSGKQFDHDEYVAYFFIIGFGTWAALFNSFSKKHRLLLYEVKRELQKSYDDLTKSDKQKTKFFQNISHELRTPLTLIINPLTELIAKYKDDDLKLISKNANRLYRLVNQLLDFQKTSGKKNDITLVPINVNEFLTKVSDYYREECEKKSIKLSLEINADSNLYILGEVDALEKIIFNYLSNALKYTEDKGEIVIRLRDLDDRIRISVRDNGIGISNFDQERLFTVFTQLDGSATREYEGTGLGLALVKELAELLKGKAAVRSTVGIGSTFFVEFPLHFREKNKIDVLCVDDEIEILDYLTGVYEGEGFNGECVDNSEDALNFMIQNDVKCLITDLEMPNGDGIELLKAVKSKYPQTKRLLMTGKGDIETLTEATNDGVVEKVFLKPLQMNKILPVVKDAIKKFDNASVEKVIDVLYIDDEDNLLMSFETLMIDIGSKLLTKTVRNTTEARDILAKSKVKCILSDYQMPGEDGVEFLTYVNNNFPDIKRVLITGNDTSSIPKEALNDAHIIEILDKPISLETIRKVVKHVKKSKIKASGKADLTNYKPKAWHIEENDDDNEVTNDESAKGNLETILIVDDLKDMRNLLSLTLKNQNFSIVSAKDGVDALEKIEKNKPDLIITDWMMPRMSGIELIEKLKEDKETASIPTILLTAKSDEESKLIGTQGGASAYIGKPFNKIELLSIVKNLLNLKKGEEEIRNLNKELSENVLKRFLPPALVDGIVSGKSSFDEKYSKVNVTILFTDICSFSRMSDEIGPQNISKMLNTYLEEMTNIIFECDGTIDKIMGDSVMALWGAPESMNHEDQVAKAYSCSKALNSKLAEINEKWKKDKLPTMTQRIGIHHGPAVVGYFGGRRRSDYTAIGGTINKAQRIESVANPGEIYISDVVRDILPHEAEWEKAGEFNLKGVGDNVKLYRILQK